MSIFKIAWRSIQQRALASSLTAFSMALGVSLVIAVLMIMGVVTQQFESNSSLGYDLVVGAKGSKLQLVLNAVYYIEDPVENLPYSRYLDFLPAEESPTGEGGRFAKFTRFAIPLCLGDFVGEYRVVGTTPMMFEYTYDDNGTDDPADDLTLTCAEGEPFAAYSPEYGYFGATIGSRVAATMNLKVGDTVAPTHGDPDGEVHDTFLITGILAPTGTPADRAVFVNMEGFYLLSGHAKPIEEEEETAEEEAEVEAESESETEAEGSEGSSEEDSTTEEPTGQSAGRAVPPVTLTSTADAASEAAPHWTIPRQPLPLEEREITALLVRTSAPVFSPGIANQINESNVGQAVYPVREILTLINTFVRPFKALLLVMTVMICIVSGVSILVSIYNSMSQRQHEIAVIRSLGAGRGTVMLIVLTEAIMLALGGGLLGWVGGHAAVAAISPFIEANTGVQVGFFSFAPGRFVLESSPGRSIIDIPLSPELVVIPGLIVLAIIVGFWPAVAAYRTDVAKALTAKP